VSTDFFLEAFGRYKDRGLEAHREGDGDEARYNLLRASEFLYKAASASTGRLRTTRIANAEKLLKMAQSIAPGKSSPGETRRAAPAGDAEEQGKISSWVLTERPRVRFDDVAGLDGAIEAIRVRMVYPFTHPEAARKYAVPLGGGVLLYGPPGTGKTLLARAVAGELDATFFAIKPSAILSKWVGEAERNIQDLFDAARAEPRAVIFVDEIEALAPVRTGEAANVMSRVVPQLLAELEGVEHGDGDDVDGGAMLFLGATNAPWALDPAILRPGRFDEILYVGLPEVAARRRILELNLEGPPLADDVNLDELALGTEGRSGADLRNLCRKACSASFLDEVRTGEGGPITQRSLLALAEEIAPSVRPKDLERYASWATRAES
jgi:SpoVK/Ycf46/Vps4 family AAA+-type ATPase